MAMEKDAAGRWWADGETAAGMVVVRDESGRGKPRFVVDGWEVDADTYRLFLYDREIDAREEHAHATEQIAEILEHVDRALAVIEATRSAPAAAPPRPAPAAAPQRAPLAPVPAPAERTFDQPAPDTRKFDR